MNDLQVLNLHKMDGFQTLIQPDLPEWLGEEEDDDDDDEDEEEGEVMIYIEVKSHYIRKERREKILERNRREIQQMRKKLRKK